MKKMIKSLMQTALGLETQDTYHRRHADQANEILKTLESFLGKTNPYHIKLAETYSQDHFGAAQYAPWLRVYTALAGEFREGWIPDNYYGLVVVPRIKGGYAKIGDLKGLTLRFFDDDSFPDLAYFVNGIFFSTIHEAIPRDSVFDYLFSDSDNIVFKLEDSLQGRGVYFYDKSNFDIKNIEVFGNGVFQLPIEQHPLFKIFSPNAVATLRLTTVVDNAGEISLRACYLRLGRNEDTHVQSQSHIRVPIALADGAFCERGYLANWLAVCEHPDSKVVFSGNSIPLFSECVSKVVNLHKKIPFVRCIGWDVTVDVNNRVKVMEWNSNHNDIKFSEATQGPCFLDLGWDRFSS